MRSAVLSWADDARRDLPWRRTRDPWAILVSELMLQQTQVARVIPRYERFLARFPSVGSCADAPVSSVIELWDGLGYNRRAVHLHRAAVVVTEQHGGEVPETLAALLELPGVGPYTARAVLAFAYERPVGVLDTNVGRIVSRAVAGRSLEREEAQRLADELVPLRRAWAWNQALLDLGATVCVKRSPRCRACPIALSCAWFAAGAPDPDPADGSAAVSTPQSRFEGSLRQLRGRLVAALRVGPLAMDELPAAVGCQLDPERAEEAAVSLVRDGLAEVRDGRLQLPV